MPRRKKTHFAKVDEDNRDRHSSRRKGSGVPSDVVAVHSPPSREAMASLAKPEAGQLTSVALSAESVRQLQQQRGNTYVQRIIQHNSAENSALARKPEKTTPVASGKDLGLGKGLELTLGELDPGKELSLKYGMPDLDLALEAESPSRYLSVSPPSDLCWELVENWARQWLVLQGLPKVEPEASELAQLFAALKGNVEKWARMGPAYAIDPLRTEEAARLKAWQSTLKRYKKVATAKPGKEEAAWEEIQEKQLEEIKDSVVEAFKKALESTQFYPKWKDNLKEMAEEHWPALAIVGGTAVGGLLAGSIAGGEWETEEKLTSLLPEVVDTEIDIDEHWKLIIASKESSSIGKEGKGPVIGLSPYLGFRYKFDDGKTLEFYGNANMRFATEEEAPFDIRGAGFLGLKATW